MLVLSRRLGERILIGDNVVIEVCKIDKDKIRLGITAPADVHILREELKGGTDPQGKGGQP
jgi:carbon storage regulator